MVSTGPAADAQVVHIGSAAVSLVMPDHKPPNSLGRSMLALRCRKLTMQAIAGA